MFPFTSRKRQVTRRIEPTLLAGDGTLPSPGMPKAKPKRQAIPSWKDRLERAESNLRREDLQIYNRDVTDFRYARSTAEVLRNFSVGNPDLSATVNSHMRVGIPENYSAVARDLDGAINPEATGVARELITRLTFLSDPLTGYNETPDLQSLSESLAYELLVEGGCIFELVLDNQRLPSRFEPVSYSTIEWQEGSNFELIPVQILGQEERKLDLPTIFMASIDQSLLTPYASSPIQAAIQAVMADSKFLNDLRRAMQRVVQPRLVATLLEDKIRTVISPTIRNDQEKYDAFIAGLVDSLQDQLEGLEPETALIGTDSVEYDILNANSQGSNAHRIWETIQTILERKLLAGAKSMPAVLGRDATASSATASVMLFIKNADIIRRKLNTLYSRALTVAMRLLGYDVVVTFKYENLDIRPESELEAYKAMKQSRILERLSLGLISDEEAVMELTGNLPPPGYKNLAGTMFTYNKGESANPDSQTSNMNKGGAPDNLQPSTPQNPKD